MFCLRSEKFGAAAIEKKIEKMSYTRIAEPKTGNRKEDRKENMFAFIIENVFSLNVKKMHNITLERTRPHFTYKNRKCV